MRALWLDYQRPDPWRRRPGMILLAASLLATGLLLFDYFAVAAQLADVRLQVGHSRQATPEQGTPANRSSAPPLPGVRGEGVRAVVHSAASWDALFVALEAAGDESVTLLGMQPGAAEIRISGEAKSMAASMAYLQRLQAATALANVHLTQSEVVLAHPQRPVRFALAAEWRSSVR